MSWSVKLDETGDVRVTIQGRLDDAEGTQAARAVLEHVGPSPRDLVFDVALATGIRRNVRLAWQSAFAPHSNQIRQIVIIEGSSVVRMSLNVMAMFLGVPVSMRDGAMVEADAPVRRPRSRSSSRAMTRPLTGPVLGPVVTSDPPKRERSWAGLLMRRAREESRPNF